MTESREGDLPDSISEFDAGFLLGVLVGEGHFGGDGRQPQVTLRMHTDHARVFAWLMARFPNSRLYGPYDHAGRRYFQWMARGSFLRDELVPILDRYLRPEHSQRVWERYVAMCRDYRLGEPGPPSAANPATAGDGVTPLRRTAS